MYVWSEIQLAMKESKCCADFTWVRAFPDDRKQLRSTSVTISWVCKVKRGRNESVKGLSLI
jgi:hypothetical protein